MWFQNFQKMEPYRWLSLFKKMFIKDDYRWIGKFDMLRYVVNSNFRKFGR